MQMASPIELATSVTKSRTFFCQLRWRGRRTCPRCGHRKLYSLNSGQIKCKACGYKFRDFTGTYVGKLRIPLDVVSHLLYLFVLGVPAYRMRWYVPVSLATIEKTLRTFRQAIYGAAMEELNVLRLSGELELDEAMFGGHRKGKRGWGAHGKHVVFGIYQRGGQVITFPVPDRKWQTLLPLIERHTEAGSVYYTDDFHGYVALEMRGKHERVTHKRDEYVRGGTHLNGIEGFWSFAKTWLYHYRGVPRDYFAFYLKEIEFRFNHRHQDLFPLVAQLVVKLVPDR